MQHPGNNTYKEAINVLSLMKTIFLKKEMRKTHKDVFDNKTFVRDDETESDDEVYENYDDIGNYATSSKFNGGSSSDFK